MSYDPDLEENEFVNHVVLEDAFTEWEEAGADPSDEYFWQIHVNGGES